ncbi:hypothetical protein, partial [Peptostreptococcus russellii]
MKKDDRIDNNNVEKNETLNTKGNNEENIDKDKDTNTTKHHNNRFRSRIKNSKRRRFKFDPKSWKEKYLLDPRIVFNIYKRDVMEILRNTAVLVIILGLTIVPSLYAWFNIKAFWDPYGNAKYLKVAIVNQDVGTEFKNQSLKLGDKVVDNLKENAALDWQFVSKQRAE